MIVFFQCFVYNMHIDIYAKPYSCKGTKAGTGGISLILAFIYFSKIKEEKFETVQ